MEASEAKRKQDDVRLFAPRHGVRLAGILFAGLLIAIWPGLLMMMSASTPAMLFYPLTLIMHVILIPLMFLLGLMVYFSFAGMRLVITPHRIEYYTVGYSIASDWNDVAGVGPGPGLFAGAALTLRRPATKLSSWLSTFFALRPLFLIMAVAEGRVLSSQGQAAVNVIPLSVFTGDWKRSEIGELLRRYAPQVFDPTQQPAATPKEVNASYEDVARESQPKAWPVIAGFAGYTGLLCAGVLLVARMQMSGLEASLIGHTAAIRNIAYAPDGKLLASASDDKTIRVWDVAAKKEKWILHPRTERAHPPIFRPDGAVLASSSYDHSVDIWDMTNGQEIALVNGHEDALGTVAFSPDGKLLATARTYVSDPSKQATTPVLLWDATGFTQEIKPLASVSTSFSSIRVLAFSPDSKLLAIGNDDGTVEIRDVTSQQLKATFARDGEYDSIESLLYSPDGRKLARLNHGAQIYLYETTTYQPTAPLPLPDKPRAGSIAFSPDGKLLAVGCEDQKIRMVLVATGEIVATFLGHNANVEAVAFSPDGKTLASADGPFLRGGATKIYLWDTSKLTAEKAETR